MSTKLITTIQEQISALTNERSSNVKEREVRQDQQDAITKLVEDEKRVNLDDKETRRFTDLAAQMAEIDTRNEEIDADLEGLEERLVDLRASEEARAKATKAAEKWADHAPDTERKVGGARVTNEARTYTPDAERRGISFFQDVYSRQFNNDRGASERLERHDREARLNEASLYEQRAVGTSAFAGLTVPQYLTEMAAPFARAGAPTVAICNRHPLPSDGQTVNISRITTGTAVSAQTAENTGVTNTDADDTNLAVNVRTYAGQQDVSRQAIERGTGVDSILIQDLMSAYWTELNSDIVNGGGTGEHTGVIQTSNIQSVTYTDTTASVAELYPKLADLIQKIQTGAYQGITHFVMHPRRWWWIAKELTTSFPLVSVPMAGNQQAGSFQGQGYNNTMANLFGVPVVLDATIPTTNGAGTNQDVILGVSSPELHLWHDDSAPLFIRAEQTANAGKLQVKFVVYGYSAFTAGRYPGAHGQISGTGLTTPSF